MAQSWTMAASEHCSIKCLCHAFDTQTIEFWGPFHSLRTKMISVPPLLGSSCVNSLNRTWKYAEVRKWFLIQFWRDSTGNSSIVKINGWLAKDSHSTNAEVAYVIPGVRQQINQSRPNSGYLKYVRAYSRHAIQKIFGLPVTDSCVRTCQSFGIPKKRHFGKIDIKWLRMDTEVAWGTSKNVSEIPLGSFYTVNADERGCLSFPGQKQLAKSR